MKLEQLLAPLSRSSAEAVRTLGDSSVNPVKDYLYIETPIEVEFQNLIETHFNPETIIFVCGSSGDGKSEILIKFHEKYENQYLFHLDATHSFKPDMNATQTLDQQFSDHKSKGRPIVVGINIGMLGNYAEEGLGEHRDIIQSINLFLNQEQESLPKHHIFLDFEDYPKFVPEENGVAAEFIEKLLTKLTQPTEDNIFYQSWLEEKDQHPEILHANFRMLQIPEVQNILIWSLLKVRLKYDQFLTVRTLLDFIYIALTGPGYLFDNIFTDNSTELTTSLAQFDPCTVRAKDIDIFLIQNSMNIEDDEFEHFKKDVNLLVNDECMSTASWIRLFYILQDLDLGSNYHQKFKVSFTEELYSKYLKIWRLHDQFDSKNRESRDVLRDFYQYDLLNAIYRFANRLAPELSHKEWYLASHNGYCLSTRAVMKDELKTLEANRSNRLGYFNAMIKLNGDVLKLPLQVGITFLDLIMKINSGYRPNKHDKNNIVILEEFIDLITDELTLSKQIKIHTESKSWVLTNDEDYNEITVEEDY